MNQLRSALRASVATPERFLLIVTLLVRIVPAYLVYGSDDVQGWETIGRAIVEGKNAYATQYAIVWPPLWLPWTALAQLNANGRLIPPYFILKLLPITADIIITFVLYHSARRFGLDPFRTAMWWALNPISIYASSIHGQFDSIPTMCVLLSITIAAAAVSARDERRSAVWLGIGAGFKTWPLFVLPALMTPGRSVRSRFVTGLITVSIFLVCLSTPALFVGVEILREAFVYRGFSGWWGLSSLGNFASLEISERMYSAFFDLSMIIAGILLFFTRTSPPRAALLMLLTFYVTSPGFALQYLVWLLPVALLADQSRARIYTVIASILIAIEALFRPYTGHIGEMFRGLPHAGYAKAIGGETDLLWTTLGRLPLWFFCIAWWVLTIIASIRPRGSSPAGNA